LAELLVEISGYSEGNYEFCWSWKSKPMTIFLITTSFRNQSAFAQLLPSANFR